MELLPEFTQFIDSIIFTAAAYLWQGKAGIKKIMRKTKRTNKSSTTFQIFIAVRLVSSAVFIIAISVANKVLITRYNKFV